MYVLHPLGKMVVVWVGKRDSVWESVTAIGYTACCVLSKSRVTASVFTLVVPSPYFSVFCIPYPYEIEYLAFTLMQHIVEGSWADT